MNKLLTALGRIESELNDAIMLAQAQGELEVHGALIGMQVSAEWRTCCAYDESVFPPSGMSEDEAEQRVRY